MHLSEGETSGARIIFLISLHAFKLRSAFALATDFKDDFAAMVLDQEIWSLLAGRGFQILDGNPHLTHGHGEKVFSQSALGLIHWPVEQADRWHQQDLGLTQHICSSGKDALQDKGLLKGFGILLGFILRDSEIF
jgi:hypothetical protein